MSSSFVDEGANSAKHQAQIDTTIAAETCNRCKLQKRPSPPPTARKSNDFEAGFKNVDLKQQNKKSTDSSMQKPTPLERLARRIPCLGIILSLFASLTLATAGMLVKITYSVHGVQVAMFRALIQLIIYVGIIVVRELPWLPERGESLAVAARSLLGGFSITMSYFALKLIPLGDATTIRFSLPIWTLIISYLFLGEACGLLKLIAVCGSISGVLLIAKPDTCLAAMETCASYLHLSLSSSSSSLAITSTSTMSTPTVVELDAKLETDLLPESFTADYHVGSSSQLVGSILALSSSICLAISYIALRLCKKTRPETIIAWLSLVSVLVGLATLLTINEFRLPDNTRDVIFIILNGLLGSVGQYLITSALKIEQSGLISLARTFDIVVAFSYSATLLHEQIAATSVLGAALVSISVITVILPKWFCNAKQNQNNIESDDEEDDDHRNYVNGTTTTVTNDLKQLENGK